MVKGNLSKVSLYLDFFLEIEGAWKVKLVLRRLLNSWRELIEGDAITLGRPSSSTGK